MLYVLQIILIKKYLKNEILFKNNLLNKKNRQK